MPRWLARAGARPIHVFFWTGQANSYVRQWVQLQSCFPWSVSCSWNCKSLKQPRVPRGCDCWLLDRWRPGAGEGARACEKGVPWQRPGSSVQPRPPSLLLQFVGNRRDAWMKHPVTPNTFLYSTEQYTYWWYRYSQVLIHNNTGGIYSQVLICIRTKEQLYARVARR